MIDSFHKAVCVCCVFLYVMFVTLTVNGMRLGSPAEESRDGPDKRLSELLYGHFGTGYHCMYNGRRIIHDHVYNTSKCLKSRCFFGTSFIHSEGCEDSVGECHDVNTMWTERCVTYKCQRTTTKGYKYYQHVVANALCRDQEGTCHQQGQTFSVKMEGKLHNNCQCEIKENMIYYRCVTRTS